MELGPDSMGLVFLEGARAQIHRGTRMWRLRGSTIFRPQIKPGRINPTNSVNFATYSLQLPKKVISDISG